MRRLTIITLVLIVFLAAILRLYRVTVNPPHLYWDEASIAYNAYSLNVTGKDEWGQGNPLLFKSFGDYKLPLYIYLVAASQKIFGLTDFAVRFPASLAGTLAVLGVFFLAKEQIFLIKECFKNFPFVNHPDAVSLLTAFLLAVSPWALQFSRGGFEANVALFCQVFGLLFFLLAMRKNVVYLYLASFFFAASVYTYHSAAVSAPLLFIVLTVPFRKKLLANFRQIVPPLIFLCLLVLPYFPSYVLSAQGRVRATGESVLNMPGSPLTNFVNNYVANFSPDYLFFHGDQSGRHSVKKIGELYLWQLPAVLAGIYFFLKNRSKMTIIVFAWLLVAAIPPALTLVSPHALRGLLAVRSWQVVGSIGLVFLLWRFRFLHKLRYFLIPVVLYAFIIYLHLYYVHYPVAYAADWQDGQRQTIQFIKRIEGGYDKIYVYKEVEPIYIQLYWPIAPAALQESRHDTSRLGKIAYFDFANFPVKSRPTEKILVVLPGWADGGGGNLLRVIKNATGDPVFAIYDF